jgi:hypothetical protein
MKNCPKCEIEHEKYGIFCSRKCANSRGPRSQQFKDLVSKKLSGRKQTPKTSIKISHKILCEMCETLHTNSRFCCKICYLNYFKSIRNEKQNYKIACQFRFNVYNYIDRFDLHLIVQYGWYSAANRGNNQNGVQRDHMYSISDGFKNNIDPFIISHPANCRLVHNFENQRKRSKSSILLEDLIQRIKNWKQND